MEHDERLQEILSSTGSRLLQPGEELSDVQIQQQEESEVAQMRLMRQQQEAQSFEKTRKKLLDEGGGGAVVTRATAMKVEAKKSLDDDKPQQALGLYLLALWFCHGGPFPAAIAPSKLQLSTNGTVRYK